MRDISQILTEVKARTKRGHKFFYKPFHQEESLLLKQHYEEELKDSFLKYKPNGIFRNKNGTILANGYTRIVYGDYGAYVEFSASQINQDAIKSKWPGKPSRPVKYIWMESKDNLKTKVYFQQGTVSYADYRVGMYYIDPKELIGEINE